MTTEAPKIYPVYDKDSANLAIDAMGLFIAREVEEDGEDDPQFAAGMAFLLGMVIALDHPEWCHAIVLLTGNAEYMRGRLVDTYLEQFPIQIEAD